MDANTREATESKMTAGSEMETAGVTGKSKETAGSEAETVVGTESGVDTEVGTDSESTVDRWREPKQVRGVRSRAAEVMRERTCDRRWRVP